MKVKIKEIEKLLSDGKVVKVKTLNGEYTKIVRYVNKGILNTFLVKLENDMEIKVSREHKFFTSVGWVECKDIIVNKHFILCEDSTYKKVVSCNLIGDGPIVDIEVEHPEHCYFGNGMLNHNTGKSLISAHVLAETQRKGGLAVFIDTETAVSQEFMHAVGIDTSKMVYITHDTIEDIFDTVETIINRVRKSDSKRIVTIVIDSIAAASCKAEMLQDHGAAGYATQKAIGISKAMRKITNLMGKQRVLLLCTNQLRQKVGFVGAGDSFTTSGGKALGFHASVRVRLKSTGRINNSNKEVVGMKTKAIVTKNRMGPPFRSAEFNIFFDRGIDNYGNWIERLIDYDIITPHRPNKVDETGKKKSKDQLAMEKEASKKDKVLKFEMVVNGKLIELVTFEKKDFLKLIADRPDVKEYLYGKLCEKFIFKYNDPKASSSDEIEISESGDSDE